MKPLSAIILNYGTPQLAIDCANSVLPQIEALDGALVIVDNASPDNSYAQLSAWREGLGPAAPVEVILSPRNDGFASGNNIGVRARKADFHLLLNSDTIVREGALAAMLAAMREDEYIGILGAKITDEAGVEQTSRFRNPTPFGEFVEASGLDLFYKIFARRVVPILPNEDADADWIGFPCVMLRARMIDEIGLLDEGYFMYFEDADYCRRAAQAGWKIATCPDAEVAHFQGASSKVEEAIREKRRLPAYYYASRARYFTRWYGKTGFVAANLLWHLGRAAGWARLLAFRRPRSAPAGAAHDIWRHPSTK